MAGRMDFEFHFHRPRDPNVARSDDDPMRIAILGDLSGRGNRRAENHQQIADRSVVSVDLDNIQTVMKRFSPQLQLDIGNGTDASLKLEFSSLDDFHPDQLFQKLPLFQALRQTRDQLANPATFAQAASQLRLNTQLQAAETKIPPTSAASAATEENSTTLERLLGNKPLTGPQPIRQGNGANIDNLIRQIVAPFIVPDADPRQSLYIASMDEAIGAQMRNILHHPDFQALESLWRAVDGLVANIEIGEQLQLCLIDVTKGELNTDLAAAADDLQSSGLYRLLVEKASKGAEASPWSILIGHYSFGAGEEDVRLLAAFGAIASQTDGPFLTAADPSIVGCPSFAKTADPRDWKTDDSDVQKLWQTLRGSSHAPWIGLAAPRILVRLPYGKRTDAVERFAFEELPAVPSHEMFLWGNPAIACTQLLAMSFIENGWSMTPGDQQDVGELPSYVYEHDGEKTLLPCAEALLSERAADAMLNHGIMPLLSYKNRNAARLIRFQSVANPAAPLRGKWS